jgi:hypothetical protein
MSTTSQPERSGRGRLRIVVRTTLAIVILVPLSVLFTQSWHAASVTVAQTASETDGITFLRVLQPVLVALTEDETLAVSGKPVDFTAIDKTLQAAGGADQRYGGGLQTHSRWTNFVAAVDHLRTLRKSSPIDAYNSYSAVSELLLDVYERIRDRSGLVRDQESDVFFLEDAAVRALPASVVGAGRYGDSIIAEFTSSGANVQTAALNVSTYRTLLDQDAEEVEDDVSDAVDATSSRTLSTTLLGAIDDYGRSVESLEPQVAQQVTKADISSTTGVPPAQVREEATAVALSAALFDEIDTLVAARGRSASDHERLAIGCLVAALLLIAALLYLDLGRRPAKPTSGPAPGPAPETTGGGHRRELAEQPARRPMRERVGVPQ